MTTTDRTVTAATSHSGPPAVPPGPSGAGTPGTPGTPSHRAMASVTLALGLLVATVSGLGMLGAGWIWFQTATYPADEDTSLNGLGYVIAAGLAILCAPGLLTSVPALVMRRKRPLLSLVLVAVGAACTCVVTLLGLAGFAG